MRISTATSSILLLRSVPTCSGYKVALEVQASHHAIAAHRLVVLAEVNTVSQDWGNLLFKLSLAEALEEISTSIAKEAWLYNENAINFCFDYIHDSNLSSYIRFFRITPSLFSQRGLHLSPKPSLLRSEGCSCVRYSYRRVLVSSAEPVPTRGCR